jgi:hypothetical protein
MLTRPGAERNLLEHDYLHQRFRNTNHAHGRLREQSRSPQTRGHGDYCILGPLLWAEDHLLMDEEACDTNNQGV